MPHVNGAGSVIVRLRHLTRVMQDAGCAASVRGGWAASLARRRCAWSAWRPLRMPRPTSATLGSRLLHRPLGLSRMAPLWETVVSSSLKFAGSVDDDFGRQRASAAWAHRRASSDGRDPRSCRQQYRREPRAQGTSSMTSDGDVEPVMSLRKTMLRLMQSLDRPRSKASCRQVRLVEASMSGVFLCPCAGPPRVRDVPRRRLARAPRSRAPP